MDQIFASLIVTPCVVGYWRSIWMLIDHYLEETSPLVGGLISLLIGFISHIIFISYQNVLERHLHPNKDGQLYYIISRFYTVYYAFSCINYWRGPWNLLNYFHLTDATSNGVIVLISVLIFAIVKALSSLLVPPFIIETDAVANYFRVTTLFRTSMGEKTSLYVLDCLFSIVIVGLLVVFVWRGVWQLVDIFLFPNDNIISSWSSLVLGYFIVAVAFLLQPMMRYLCDRLTGAARLLVADLFILLALFGTVNVWRGIWNLLNIYFLPDNLELSCWITHWVSLIILILCRCSNSLLVRGVYIDAEEPAGKCVIFPCYYLRVMFRKKKLKNMNITTVTLNDTIKANSKESEIPSFNHIVTVSNTVEENNDIKQSK